MLFPYKCICSGNTPLHCACSIGWFEGAFALVHRGASLCAKDQMYHPSSSFVFLFLFCFCFCFLFLFLFLFLFIHLHRLFFLSCIHRGFTALHSAARYGHSDIADRICILHQILDEEDHLSWINLPDMYAAPALSFYTMHSCPCCNCTRQLRINTADFGCALRPLGNRHGAAPPRRHCQ